MIFNWFVFIFYIFAATCFSFIVYLTILGSNFTDWACVDYDQVDKQFDYIVGKFVNKLNLWKIVLQFHYLNYMIFTFKNC